MQLERQSNFISTDLGETQHAVTSALNDHQLICEDGQVNASMRRFNVGNVIVLCLKYGPSVSIIPRARDGFYLVQFPTRGHVQVRFGKAALDVGEGFGVILPPSIQTTIHWSEDSEQILLKIPVSSFEKVARGTLNLQNSNMASLREPTLLNTAEARPICSLVDFAISRNLLHEQAGIGKRHLDGHIEEVMVGQILLSKFALTDESPLSIASRIVPKYIRYAELYMHRNISRPISTSEIAASMGVSVRTLNKVYRDFLGTTPTAALLDMRLRAVRKGLIDAPPHARVGEIARQWGFSHIGRFSNAYFGRFGEYPKETVRK